MKCGSRCSWMSGNSAGSGTWSRSKRCRSRVKKQLLWAFDSSGKLDGDRFTTILNYESVQLTPAQMVELASEMTARPRFWDHVHPN